MINSKETNIVKLSATRKDFYQLWEELLDTAKKLSNRWDPSSTNESDPGIVLLKVLTAVTDKLNYNIDKNILEAFRPSAAQRESRMKLCARLGYTMKYYRSAETTVNIKYIGDRADAEDNIALPSAGLTLPAYTNVSNSDSTINYVTTKAVTFYSNDNQFEQNVPCIEGQYVQCRNDNNNLITLNELDANFRYYLPETSIAENGVFVYSLPVNGIKVLWAQVNNLNRQALNTRCYTFGFDSTEGRPYLQFPEDVGTLLESGLNIYYIRTSGSNGNISAQTLTKFVPPSTNDWKDYQNTDELFIVKNYNAATNGANPESITEAYENYKKTIGTFDTLVTCRDYMNKLYTLLDDENYPYISNIIVSDIRNDINKSVVLCTYDDTGILYKEQKAVEDKTAAEINNFDLVLYPFNTIKTINKDAYKKSFKPVPRTSLILPLMEDRIKEFKSRSHVYKQPRTTDIYCIKNYLRLNAIITTTSRVSQIEEAAIKEAIKTALYTNFNARKLDFGQEIPFDSILTTIETASTKIKNVSLEEPLLYTCIMDADGNEYSIGTKLGDAIDSVNKADLTNTGTKLYQKLLLRNILAGRIALFDYNTDFSSSFNEAALPDQQLFYPDPSTTAALPLCKITANCTIKKDENNNFKPAKNEVIVFSAQNYKTTITYPAYVNYYLHLASPLSDNGRAATFESYINYLRARKINYNNKQITIGAYLATLLNAGAGTVYEINSTNTVFTAITSAKIFGEAEKKLGPLFTKDSNGKYVYSAAYSTAATAYFALEKTAANYKNILLLSIAPANITTLAGGEKLPAGLYSSRSAITTPGYLVDNYGNKYIQYTELSFLNEAYPFSIRSVPVTTVTDDGLGKDSEIGTISKNAEYKLKTSEYLLINYTKNTADVDSTNTSTTDTTTEIINKYYGPGTIIRPNFALPDSKCKHDTEGTSYSKRSGFDFSGSGQIINPDGLFTLGVNEQIEIRTPSQVSFGGYATEAPKKEIKDTAINLFWLLGSGLNNSWTDASSDSKENWPNSIFNYKYIYTLKSGEYLYYTDKYKSNLAYYGSGTRLEIYTINKIAEKDLNNWSLVLSGIANNSTDETTITSEDILQNGLSVIPFISCTFDGTRQLLIKELQYINLNEGDVFTFSSAKVTELNDTPYTLTTDDLKKIRLQINGEDKTGLLTDINTINGQKSGWSVFARLNINMGPDQPQIINKTAANIDNIKIFDAPESAAAAVFDSDNLSSGAEPQIYIASNYDLTTTNGSLVFYSPQTKAGYNDVKFKIFKQLNNSIIEGAQDLIITPEQLADNNFTISTDKLLSQAQSEPVKKIKFDFIVPSNCVGAMMLYCSGINSEDTTVCLGCTTDLSLLDIRGAELTKMAENDAALPEASSGFVWYRMKKGLNIIRVNKSGEFKLATIKGATEAETVIYSPMRIIKCNDDGSLKLNPLLNLDTDNTANGLNKSLIDIIYNNYPQFYFICPVDQTASLIFNSDGNIKNIDSPAIWYDLNNINNDFVISEIDADYLDSGIKFSYSSKI